jgi:hypothetical protein
VTAVFTALWGKPEDLSQRAVLVDVLKRAVFATRMDAFEIIRSGYLARCWIPRRVAERWLAKHRLQSLLSFFAPRKEKRVAAKIFHEKAAARALCGAVQAKRTVNEGGCQSVVGSTRV